LLESELNGPDEEPVSLRILGEDLVAFRDTEGRLGVLEANCPHRQASLSYGRNEECGLRCIYHGWKFDVEGKCVDLPSEPNASQKMRDKIKIASYPAVERSGAIWIYMGPKDKMPAPPEYEWARFSKDQTAAIKRFQPCNYAQALEGGIDSAHIFFLHRDFPGAKKTNSGPNNIHGKFASECRNPEFSVNETDYGLQIIAKRALEDIDDVYYRVTQFMVPCFQMIPPILVEGRLQTTPVTGNVWVPIDDHNTWNWGFSSDVAPLSELQRERLGPEGIWGDLNENFHAYQNEENRYQFDLERQRKTNFSGIHGVRNQDAAVVESMGPIVDRTKENLGHSDTGIVMFRRLMLRLADELENGNEPEAAMRPESFNIRSVSVILDKAEDLQAVLPKLAAGEPISAEAAE
jgi:phthalate 4,5-dioxygenase